LTKSEVLFLHNYVYPLIGRSQSPPKQTSHKASVQSISKEQAIKIALENSRKPKAVSKYDYVEKNSWVIITYKELHSSKSREKTCYRSTKIITIDSTSGEIINKQREKVYCVQMIPSF
jgi:hypothetical protein